MAVFACIQHGTDCRRRTCIGIFNVPEARGYPRMSGRSVGASRRPCGDSEREYRNEIWKIYHTHRRRGIRILLEGWVDGVIACGRRCDEWQHLYVRCGESASCYVRSCHLPQTFERAI